MSLKWMKIHSFVGTGIQDLKSLPICNGVIIPDQKVENLCEVYIRPEFEDIFRLIFWQDEIEEAENAYPSLLRFLVHLDFITLVETLRQSKVNVEDQR